MQEVVRRRYSRMIEEGTPLPDLIITDGGKGQMEVVRAVIEDEPQASYKIAGLAKDDRHRTNELLFRLSSSKRLPYRLKVSPIQSPHTDSGRSTPIRHHIPPETSGPSMLYTPNSTILKASALRQKRHF